MKATSWEEAVLSGHHKTTTLMELTETHDQVGQYSSMEEERVHESSPLTKE